MGAVSALSVAQNHALGSGTSGTEPGVEWLARAPAAAASQQADGVATQGVDRTRPALLAGSPALEAPAKGTVRGVKMMIGFDRVNRQMRQGELVTVQNGTGQPAFSLRGGGTTYRLLGADGQPITDLGLAEVRAHQLIGNGAAARLREVRLSSPGGAEVTAPGNRTSPRLSFDLESPDINVKGGRGQVHLGLFRLGGRGSALTSGDAVARAQAMGINVRETNENPKGPPEIAQLHAWVELTNDRTGGRQFHNFTRNLNPGTFDPSATSYKLPANASRAFIEGYDQASREFGMALGAQLVGNIAEARAAIPGARRNGSISPQVRSTPVVPTGQPVQRTQPPVARSPATANPSQRVASTARPTPESIPRSPPVNAGSTRSLPPKALSLLDARTGNSVTAALRDLPTMVNGSPAWQGHCASYSGLVAKRIAGVDMQTPLQRGSFKLVTADNIKAQLAIFGPNRQGIVRVGNNGHQFNWVTNGKGQAVFVDATTGRTGTQLSDMTAGLPAKLVAGDIRVNAFDRPHR